MIVRPSKRAISATVD